MTPPTDDIFLFDQPEGTPEPNSLPDPNAPPAAPGPDDLQFQTPNPTRDVTITLPQDEGQPGEPTEITVQVPAGGVKISTAGPSPEQVRDAFEHPDYGDESQIEPPDLGDEEKFVPPPYQPPGGPYQAVPGVLPPTAPGTTPERAPETPADTAPEKPAEAALGAPSETPPKAEGDKEMGSADDGAAAAGFSMVYAAKNASDLADAIDRDLGPEGPSFATLDGPVQRPKGQTRRQYLFGCLFALLLGVIVIALALTFFNSQPAAPTPPTSPSPQPSGVTTPLDLSKLQWHVSLMGVQNPASSKCDIDLVAQIFWSPPNTLDTPAYAAALNGLPVQLSVVGQGLGPTVAGTLTDKRPSPVDLGHAGPTTAGATYQATLAQVGTMTLSVPSEAWANTCH